MADSDPNNAVGQHGTQPFTPISQAPGHDGHVCPTCGRSDYDDSNDNDDSSDEEDYNASTPCLLSENYDYRSAHLMGNNIHVLGRSGRIPDFARREVALAFDPDSRLPDPTPEEVLKDPELAILREVHIHKYDIMRIFMDKIAHDASHHFEIIKCSKQMPIFRRQLPRIPGDALGKLISQPLPDLLFGYNHDIMYPRHLFCDPTGFCNAAANEDNLILPFLSVEIGEQRPATGHSRSFYGMENEAAAASAACVNMVERINSLIDGSSKPDIFGEGKLCSMAFSIVTNGSEARLFAAWKEPWGAYTMKNLQSWLLAEEDQFIAFQHVFRNILHWASGERWNYLDGALRWMSHELRKLATKRGEEGGLEPAPKRPKVELR